MSKILNLTELNELIPKRIKGQPMRTDVIPRIHSYLPNLTDKNIRKVIHSYLSKDATLNLKTKSQYGHISNWDVSNVTDMNKLFKDNLKFNENISDWNVSNVTNMGSMFARAESFNQPLNNWNVSNVTTMGAMFAFAESFNQPLDNWNVSNVTNMTGMFGMFNRAINFNRE